MHVSTCERAEVSELGALERDVAGVLAILGDSVSLAALHDVVAACGVEASEQELRTSVERLVRAMFIVEVPPRFCEGRSFQMPVRVALGVLRALERQQCLAGLHERIVAAVERRSGSLHRAWHQASPGRARVAAVREDWRGLAGVCAMAQRYTGSDDIVPWMTAALGDEPDSEWLQFIPEALRKPYYRTLLKNGVEALAPCGEGLLAYVRESAEVSKQDRLEAARFLVLAGRSEEATSFPGVSPHGRNVIAFLDAFWRGEHDEALRLGDAAVARRSGKPLTGLEAICHALTRFHAAGIGVPGAGDALEASLATRIRSRVSCTTFAGVERLVRWSKREDTCPRMFWGELGWIEALVEGLAYGVRERKAPPELITAVQRWCRVAQLQRYPALVRELDAVRQRLAGREPADDTLAAACRPRPAWEHALDELQQLGEALGAEAANENTDPRSIIWEVSVRPHSKARSDDVEVQIVPKACNVDSRAGRPVSLRALLDEDLTRLSEEDRRVVQAVDRDLVAYARRGNEVRLGTTLMPALVGHPRVVLEDGTPAAVVKGEVSVVAEAQGEHTAVRVEPAALQRDEVVVRAEGARIEVYVRTAEVRHLMEALPRASLLQVPATGMARLERALRGLAGKFRVRMDRRSDEIGSFVEPEPSIVARAHWDGRALRIWLRVAPLGQTGPLFVPGEGEAIVIDEVAGRLLRTERDFDAENDAIDTLFADCPVAAACRGEGHSIHAVGLEDAYGVVLELAEAPGVSLAWPKGKKLALPLRRGSAEFGLRVSSGTDWLSLSAELTVGEGEVIEFEEIIRRRLDSGRFIVLDDGRVLALARDLARRLDALARAAKSKGRVVTIRPAMLPLVAELVEGAGTVDIDLAARAALERTQRAAALEPEVPGGLKATLRPYQREAFVWMSRLAAAGLGACLADDMGLGKTVQAVAVLCARASHGPALVVAPTSVVHNWVQEVHRFAPGLAVQQLGNAARAELLDAAGPGDVIVCSYGVLVTESTRLSQKRFASLVIDEAHAVKNARTQRARAVFGIDAKFRLALTGTPIENHLGELWSVMEAAVPGLLGEQRHYFERFAKPIIEGDREVAETLRELVRPFILRRTREQVVEELPPCTEVIVTIDPHPEEEAFYEALRRRAEEEVRRQRVDRREDGAKLFAEITRLRRAAIDPRLVDAEAPKGAKVEAVVALVETLRAQGHRALVFSQFLGSVALLRKGFETAGVGYLELDGSTSAKVRAQRIEAFQGGEGDVFLMSLRAGGIGVNLTGADYVIHVDPWWNPAVEDQATARAHRIGQTRPVTVYKMVTRGSIEERVLELHETKRHLAADILEGMEHSRKLTLDDLRTLLDR